MRGVYVTCAGCKARVDVSKALPFACPESREGDGIDHVLSVGQPSAEDWPADPEWDNPYLRYRRRTLAYRVARAHGMQDEDFVSLVGGLDAAVGRVDGDGFRRTPLVASPGLIEGAELWLKHEFGGVSGSHKARHLMSVMIYLRVLEVLETVAVEADTTESWTLCQWRRVAEEVI